MLDDLNFGGPEQNRPPSRQKDPSLALGIGDGQNDFEEEFPSEKIVLTSEVPVPLPPDAFNEDNEESGEFERVGDLSEDSFELNRNEVELGDKQKFNEIGFDSIDEMEGVIPENEGEGDDRFKLTAADDQMFSELNNDKDFQMQKEEIKQQDEAADQSAQSTEKEKQ